MTTEERIARLESRVERLEAENKLLREVLDLRVGPVEEDLTLIKRRLMATSGR